MKSVFFALFLTMKMVLPMIADSTQPIDYYNWLLDAGLSDSFLENIYEDDLKRIYLENCNTEHIRVSESTMLEDGIDQLDLKVIALTIYESDAIQKVNIYILAQWEKDAPFFRGSDRIKVNWDPNVWHYFDGSFYGHIVSSSNQNKTSIKKNYEGTQPGKLYQDEIGWSVPLNKTALGNSPSVMVSFALRPIDTRMLEKNLFLSSEYLHLIGPIKSTEIVQNIEQ